MRRNLIYIALVIAAALTWSCEKEIEIDLPPANSQVVVEGTIEQGSAPLVLLTRSQGYYDPINEDAFSNLFVKNGEVKVVVDNQDTFLLDRICTDALPDSLKKLAAQLLNLSTGQSIVDVCIYTSFDPALRGKAGSRYQLLIAADGQQLTATTTIPLPVPLDTLFWKVDGKLDSLGFLYTTIQDPGTDGNAYRWFARRINKYTSGPDSGEVKDFNFIAPFGSVFDDEFVNGQVVEFGYNRGRIPGSTKEDDNNIERGYFKRGDTIAVKFTTIDRGVYQYYRTFYNSISNSGSPFASPTNVMSNVTGGLGVWAGYGIFMDTLIVE